MVKINLLENHLSMPVPAERVAELAIAEELQSFQAGARKSRRLVFILATIFMAIIAGSISLYVNRYEVVDWVEQYTGPLNILDMQAGKIDPMVAEEMRRDKIRQGYVANNFKGREMELQFLISLDSLRRENDYVFLSSLQLETGELIIELLGTSEKKIKEFTDIVSNFRGIRQLKIQPSKPTALVPGFKIKQIVTANIQSAALDASDSTYKQNYQPVKDVRAYLKKLTEGSKLKIVEESDLTASRDVTGTLAKNRGMIRFEGPVAWFNNYLVQLHQAEINIEITKYLVTLAKKKNKQDEEIIEFNILFPIMMKEMKSETEKIK